MPTRRRVMVGAIGLAAGSLYAVGLLFAQAAGLGAGLNTFFLVLAISPPPVGVALWPAIGLLLPFAANFWVRRVVIVGLLAHGLSVVMIFAADPSSAAGLGELSALRPGLTWTAVVVYLVGQACAWRLAIRPIPRAGLTPAASAPA